MNGIELLVDEHKNILSAIDVVRRKSIEIVNGGEVDIDFFENFIDFARNYADKYHHEKEEKILFKVMTEKLGVVADKLIRQGMLVEHDLGRLYISNLEDALNRYKIGSDDESKIDIISNAVGYGNHLRRHIDKEDNVVYTFANRELQPKDIEFVNRETECFELENEKPRTHYLEWLEEIK